MGFDDLWHNFQFETEVWAQIEVLERQKFKSQNLNFWKISTLILETTEDVYFLVVVTGRGKGKEKNGERERQIMEEKMESERRMDLLYKFLSI